MKNLIAVVKIFLLLLILSNHAAAQEAKKVRLGYPSLGFRQGHIWVAKAKACSRIMDSMSSRFSSEAVNWPSRLSLAAIRR